MIEKKTLFLKPDEARVIVLALESLLEQQHEVAQNPRLNWTPEARKTIREITEAADGALKILSKVFGIESTGLPPFNPGDENEFLTKQS